MHTGYESENGLIGMKRDVLLSLIRIIVCLNLSRRNVKILVGIGKEVFIFKKRIMKLIYDIYLSECRNAKFIDPHDDFCVVDVEGKWDTRVLGQIIKGCSHLLIDPPLVRGITRCTVRFVRFKGFCHFGVAAITSQHPFGNFHSQDERIIFSSSGDVEHRGRCMYRTKMGWRKQAAITIEADMDKRFLFCVVDGVPLMHHGSEPICVVRVPSEIRFFVSSINPSTVELVCMERVSSGTPLHGRKAAMMYW